jgi:hypothetical protein
VQAHEAIERGGGLSRLTGTEMDVGLFELGLLSQGCAGGAALELVEQRHCLVVGCISGLVTCLAVDLVRAPACGGIFWFCGAAAQSQGASQAADARGR